MSRICVTLGKESLSECEAILASARLRALDLKSTVKDMKRFDVADLDYANSRQRIRYVGSEPLVEIRVDLLENHINKEKILSFFGTSSETIATYRGTKQNEEVRAKFLIEAISNGATYVDIELEMQDELKEEILKNAKQSGTKTILSYHNFNETPSKEKLLEIIQACRSYNPTYVKVACFVKSKSDCTRIFSLLDDETGTTIAIGMGEAGKITRFVAPLLGSPIVYVCIRQENATAPGQITKEDFLKFTEYGRKYF